jgi:hypothetical protein
MRQTLPDSVVQKLEKIDEQDLLEQNNLLIPTEKMMEELKAIIGEKDAASFLKFTQDLEAGTLEPSTILEFEGDFSDKEKRTACHAYFKSSLKKYESDTLSFGELRKIRCFLKSGMSNKKRQKIGVTNWTNK